MSQSLECCDEKTGNRDGAALAQQRRLICGLIIWSTLLTLGFAASTVLQLIHGASPVTHKTENHSNIIPQPLPIKHIEGNLMTFEPNVNWQELVRELTWTTNHQAFISGNTDLMVNNDGLYFIYLQVTLNKCEQSCKVILSVNKDQVVDQILSSNISNSKLSTGLMAKGIALTKGNSFTVTCEPKASINSSPNETYLGVIKIG